MSYHNSMRLLTLLLCLPLISQACEPPRDANGRIKRSRTVIADFQRANPCPSTGARRGACRGWVVDHVVPLCACGLDRADNLAWQTVADAKKKDRWERKVCKG